MKIPVVALVGRPNVGKSTIFNRLVGKRVSIIEDTPGITRDRIYGMVNYGDTKFHLIDTGGIDISNASFNDEIKTQVEIAIEEADVVVFIVDAKDGLTTNDYVVRDMLKQANKKVVVAINKMDNKASENNKYDFYELGFDTYLEVSGEHNRGIGDLLDEITKDFKDIGSDEDSNITKIAIIGRPNVGKSSLVNALLKEDRVIVSEIEGTTRDAIDTKLTYDKKEYILIDTAGLRKKGKIYESVEKYSYLRSLKAIDRADICVLVIDAKTGIIEQDKHIAGYALEAGKGIIIAVNKWDLSEEKDLKKYTKLVRAEFQFITYAPIVFLSALTKKRIHTLMPEIVRVNENCKREVKTSILNNVIVDAVTLNIPPSYKGKRLKIYFCVQVATNPPRFNFEVNNKGLVHFSYQRYLENKLRENFDFEGTPLVIQFKNKGE